MAKYFEKITEHSRAWSGYLFLLLGLLIIIVVLRMAFFGHIDSEKRIWIEISLLLLIALVAERIIEQWKQPLVMVLMLLGILISPYTLEVLWPAFVQFASPMLAAAGMQTANLGTPEFVSEGETIKTFASIGVIILLFRIGIHSEIEKVFNLKNLLVAVGGVVLPFAAGFAYASVSGGSLGFSFFVGAALTATSVGITVAVLEEMKVLGKPFAQMILGAAVIDDVLALVVLGLAGNAPSGISADAIAPIVKIIGISLIFIVSGLAVGKLFMKKFFSYEEDELSKKTIAGMLAVLFFYSFASEALGISSIVGAFIAGLAVSFSPLARKLALALVPLDVLFTPIFFITLGMLVNVFEIPNAIVPVAILTVIAVATKVIGCGIPAIAIGIKPKEALLVGWGMVPRGEIALIIALIGITAVDASGKTVLDAAEYTIIASMAFITTVIVPVGLKRLIPLAEGSGANSRA